ncbi:hypothetical protein NUU61_007424 [Penicillium alfredii]|uniref:Uncharacterized protein n=1 Tax=Penicillium alfredii TaxID=1506179 RepID=A0A9W9F2W1_9EURO|nr:uncharacterized protein NUU61_007424 [Penicillium alfredii]KAJ5092554.1 hypothetical protein NUU61_007424 [Penicillium alfredii]
MPIIPDSSDFPSAAQKESKESQNRPGEQPQKASAVDHLSKGPQIPENMPPKVSKEEIEARMKELNQKK